MNIMEQLNIAVAHHNAGRLDEAEAIYRAILAVNGDEPNSLHLLGVVHRARGDLATAITLMRKTLSVAPEMKEVHHNLANALLEAGDRGGAGESYHAGRVLDTMEKLNGKLARFLALDHAQRAAERAGGKDLVLGLAAGYDLNTLHPFVKSLTTSGFRGDLVLFVDTEDPATLDFLYESGVVIMNSDIQMFTFYNPTQARYVYYFNLLGEYLKHPGMRNKYRNVMLADVRDVVFQGDPFVKPLKNRVLYARESDNLTLRTQKLNAFWLQEAYGFEALRTVIDSKFTCSGTTFGTLDGIYEYCLRVVREMARLDGPNRYKFGIDQGIHNGLQLFGHLPDCGILENGELVATLGHDTTGFSLNAEGVVVNDLGEVVPVVHQYDRVPAYKEAMLRRFGR